MIKKAKEVIRTYRRVNRRKALLSSLGFGSGEKEFFLVSFPRSGNTWLRFMLAYLISDEEEIAFHNVGEFIPDTDQAGQLPSITDRTSCFNQLPSRVIKSHDYMNSFYRDKKVIYLVRNGMDSITSYYHYVNARSHVPIPPDAFIEGNMTSIPSWPRHLLSWHQAQNKRRLVLKYEDMLKDPSAQLRLVADFIELESGQEQISSAVANSDIKRMRELELKYGYYNDTRTEAGKNSPFVRKGEVGSRNDVFDEFQVERFRELGAKAAKLYGYEWP